MMKLEELKKRIGFGEKLTLEFKVDCSATESIGSTVCAFLNTKGGSIVCGVDDSGHFVGVVNAEAERSKLEQFLHETLSPASLVAVEVYPIEEEELKLLLIDVPAGKDKPFSFNNDFYIRSGSNTRKADASTVRDMVLSASNEPERWERRKSIYLSDAELDTGELKKRITTLQARHLEGFNTGNSDEEKLTRLSLLNYGQLTNAGDLLFTKTPSRRIPQARVRATCFDDESSDRFRANRIIEGPLVRVFEECLHFVLSNIRKRSRFKKDDPVREDSYVYPVAAIREGLINALVHRDYSDYGGGITINIYPTRLEIRNSGAFPKGITEENIATGHFIKLRNPDIANVFYLLGLMERIGRGGRMITRECAAHGLLTPEWQSNASTGVTLILKLAQSQSFEFDRHQVEVLRNCLTSSSIKDLMGVVGRTDRTKFRHQVLKPLLEQALVEMTIPDKPQSSKQQYRLTALGGNALEALGYE